MSGKLVDNSENIPEMTEKAVIQALRPMAEAYGLQLSPGVLDRLGKYAGLLVAWNAKMNLTAITAPEEIAAKHFLDSLMVTMLPEFGGEIVDVGSGAGFPGMVLKVYRPEASVCLLEPNGKRQAFLQNLAGALGLRVQLVKERAEEAARKGYRERYDFAVARAVAALPLLCEYCLPLVRPGGWFVAMKGEAGQEAEAAGRAIQKLGGRLVRIQPCRLPGADVRNLVVIEKVAPTPALYPRAGGVIKKRPL